MTEKEIRDNAPDGATHYCFDEDGNIHFYKYKKESRSLMYMSDGKLAFAHNPEDAFYIEHYPSLKPLP